MVECARLEIGCAARYRGFESRPLRQLELSLSFVKSINFICNIPVGNVRRVNELEFFDCPFRILHAFVASAQFLYGILLSLVHNLNFILKGIQLLDGEIIKPL